MSTKAFFLTALLVSSPLLGTDEHIQQVIARNARVLAAAADVAPRSVSVDCNKGETLSDALEKGKNAQALDISFTGSCEEVVTIRRDLVTFHGADSTATLIGGFQVFGSSGVAFRNLNIHGGEHHPHTGDFAGINALQGSAVQVENVRIEDIRARGLQSIESAVSLRNVTILRALGGALTFRSSGVDMGGTIVANESPFGITLVNSGAVAKGADLTFNGNGYGLIVQIDSGFEHISGHLTVNDNTLVGILVAGQGIFAVGSNAEVKNNRGPGIEVDELSSYTPLIGAPGGGPSLTVTGNAGAGIAVERGSTFEVTKETLVTGNQAGITVDNSTLRLAGASIHDNTSSDVKLTFGAKGEFGAGNSIATAIVCDSTILTRGSLACGASAAAASLSKAPRLLLRPGVIDPDTLVSGDER
jgi:hypothetical protein